jgi:Holliday junction resolvasome RuvABC endonuclease subunit
VTTRVLGLDLSLALSGIALPSGQLCRITTRKGDGDKRLCHIADAVTYYVSQSEPDIAVIEKVPTSSRGFEVSAALHMVHGVTRAALARLGVPHAYVPASTLKKYATGRGGAEKQQMIDAAVDIGYAPADDNEADAAWLRLVGLHHYTRVPPSAAHALSLELISGPRSKVQWPVL